MRRRRTSRRRELPAAVALAAMGHLLALLALGWRIPTVFPPPEADLAPPMEVTLLRPPGTVRPAAPSPKRAAQVPPQRRAASPTPPNVEPNPLPPVLVQAAPGAPSAEATPSEGENVRSALRGLVGCDDPSAYRLDQKERGACDQRLAAAKPAPVAPEYSSEELAQFNADKKESIFTRKPHNECLPRIGDRPAKTAGGAPPSAGRRSGGSTTFGIGCSWSFWWGREQADFDVAAQAAAQQPRGLSIPGHGIGIVGVSCIQMTFPLLSGVEVNPNLFAHKAKQEHKPRRSHHCKVEL